MKQKFIPGGTFEALTQDELMSLVKRPSQVTRIRAASSVLLDATGSGADEIYKVPAGYEFEARRISLNMTGAVPTDPNVGVNLDGSASQSTTANNSTATPAAGAVLANLGTLAGGTYSVNTLGYVFSGVGSDETNIGLYVGGVLQFVVPAGVSGPGMAAGGPYTVIVPAGGAVVQLRAIALSAAGVYLTNISATKNSTVGGVYVAYMRSDQLIEYGQPQYGAAIQVPGVQTWGDQQGPYLRNAEVFGVAVKGLTPSTSLSVYLEGILRRPSSKDAD
jgi:hypothetical protein